MAAVLVAEPAPVHLLLISRDKQAANALSHELEQDGYQVACRVSSHAAFATGLDPEPDVVLLDPGRQLLPAETVVAAMHQYLGRGVPVLTLPSMARSDLMGVAGDVRDQLASMGLERRADEPCSIFHCTGAGAAAVAAGPEPIPTLSLHAVSHDAGVVLRSAHQTIEDARTIIRTAKRRMVASRTTAYGAVLLMSRLLRDDLERVTTLAGELERTQLALGLRLLSEKPEE